MFKLTRLHITYIYRTFLDWLIYFLSSRFETRYVFFVF